MVKINSSHFKKGHTINEGRVFSKDRNVKISESRKGMKFTEEHKKNLSKALKGRVSPRKGIKMSEETKIKLSNALKGKVGTRKGVKVSKEIRQRISDSKKGTCLGHKNNLPDGYKHSDEVIEKISKAAKLNWTKKSFRDKCTGHNQFKKSYMEEKLFKLVSKVFPNAKDNLIIQGKDFCRFPDVLLEDQKIVIEYDGKRWHKLENDKKRDLEILSLGYKILHYQGYIPSVNELLSDIESLKHMDYKYKRDFIDITIQIKKVEQYEYIGLREVTK